MASVETIKISIRIKPMICFLFKPPASGVLLDFFGINLSYHMIT
jgi:hypothetical protein